MNSNNRSIVGNSEPQPKQVLHSPKLFLILPSTNMKKNWLSRYINSLFFAVFKANIRALCYVGKLLKIPVDYKHLPMERLFPTQIPTEDDEIWHEPPPVSNCTHTKLIRSESAFTWSIDNFSEYNFDGISLTSLLVSNEFAPFADKSLHFQLVLYPKGMNNEFQDFISLYLKMVSAPLEELLQYKLSIINADGVKSNTRGAIHKFIPQKPGYGFHQFVRRSDLRNVGLGLISNDKLTIHCSINRIISQPYLDDSLDDVEKLSLMHTLSDIGSLWENDKHADVVFMIGGKELKAHKAILSARSPVFRAMFEHEMEEKRKNRVEIADGNTKVFKELLKYIYTGKVPSLLDASTAAELLHLADKYNLDYLKSFCEDSLCSELTSDNANNFYQLADMYNATKLARKSLEAIHRHAQASLDLMYDKPTILLKVHEYFNELINNLDDLM